MRRIAILTFFIASIILPLYIRSGEISKETHPALEAAEVTKEYIYPTLQEIWSKPVKCFAVIDDSKSFDEYKALLQREENPNGFVRYALEDKTFWQNLNERRLINPEIERAIQEDTIGHVTTRYPNRTTFEELALIWRNNPCAEASALAIMKIASILDHPSYNAIAQVGEGERYISIWREDMIRTANYLIENYPGTWEAEEARCGIVERTYGSFSLEAAEAQEKYIAFIEDSNIFENRYYLFSKKCKNSEEARKRFFEWDYSRLSNKYWLISDELLRKENEKGNIDGELPPEVIEIYNKHRAMRQKNKEKYPEYYVEMGELPKLYKEVRRRAPQHYVPEPKFDGPPGQEKKEEKPKNEDEKK